MKITILTENSPAPSNADLIHEHGLSVHIAFRGKHILFDMGISDAFTKNAELLGINLGEVDLAVISHHHYDHGGGIAHFLELNKNAKIYLGEAPDGEGYFKALGFINRYVGLDTHIFESHPDRFSFVDEDIEVMPDVYIIPKIEFRYPKPKGNKYIFLKKDSGWQRDDFSHEMLLVIKESDGLVVLSGCSHNGILNMVDTVNKKFPELPIKALIGGFHLVGLPMFNTMAGSKREVENIGRQTLAYPVQAIYSGHCTGQKAYGVLKGVMGEKLNPLHTGTIFET
jgi:7,8-dihydropterin-6-yl-methyl-4-(beta-D-ribofuranosyl)aminobenzene 5'-phosphate synthase